jgi:hypothetical protein
MLISTRISIFYDVQRRLNCITFVFLICLINILHGQLIIKPSEPIVLRDQFKSFVASCTGQPNTRVGRYFQLF